MTGSATPPTPAELDAALTDQDVTQARLISLALLLGTLSMAAVTVVLAVMQDEGPAPKSDDTSVLDILSLVHVVVFVTCVAVRPRAGRLMLTANWVQRPDLSPARSAIERAKSAVIVRAALLEGPALFGLTVLILAATKGQLADHPIYILNAFSTLVFAVLTLATLPNRERLLDDVLATQG